MGRSHAEAGSHPQPEALHGSIAPLAALASRESRLGARLLRRRSGTKSVSPPSSSARRVARSELIASLASARCVRWLAPLAAMFAGGAAVFVGSDETMDLTSSSVLEAFRRLLLQTAPRTSRARIAESIRV